MAATILAQRRPLQRAMAQALLACPLVAQRLRRGRGVTAAEATAAAAAAALPLASAARFSSSPLQTIPLTSGMHVCPPRPRPQSVSSLGQQLLRLGRCCATMSGGPDGGSVQAEEESLSMLKRRVGTASGCRYSCRMLRCSAHAKPPQVVCRIVRACYMHAAWANALCR